MRVEGLPEGMEIVGYRKPDMGEYVLHYNDSLFYVSTKDHPKDLVVKPVTGFVFEEIYGSIHVVRIYKPPKKRIVSFTIHTKYEEDTLNNFLIQGNVAWKDEIC